VAQANRLLALTQLKQGDLVAARAAVLEILAVAPEYRADPVQDVPAYVSLVNVVRQQVDEDAAP
jgi:Tfp pilus assembly protein PilF